MRLKAKLYLLGFKIPYMKRRRWQQCRQWLGGDGTGDETFPLSNASGLIGIVVYVSPDALFCTKGGTLLLHATAPAGARRCTARSLKVVRTPDGFHVHSRPGRVAEVRSVADMDIPDHYYFVTNGNEVET